MGGATQTVESGESTSKPLGRGRPGPIRRELRRALADLRGRGRLAGDLEVRALVAERQAELADRAAADGNGSEFERAAVKLLAALEALPLRPPDGGEPVGDDDEREPDERGRVLQLLDGPPQVGDASNA